MTVLTPGKPVRSRVPELLVENRLKPGSYRFELVVTDSDGLESAPALLDVTVFDPRTVPTPTPGPVIRPNILTRPAVLTNPTVAINPTVIRPIRRP